MPKNGQLEIDRSSNEEEPLLMDELIINPPNWLLHSGMTMVVIVAVMGVLLSWAIKYPDKIDAPFVLTSEYPPIEIVSKVASQIDTSLVQDQGYVEVGDLLFVMESTANWQSIEELCSWLEQVEKISNPLDYKYITDLEGLILGELQTPYALLQQKINELKYLLSQNYVQEKVESINSEIKKIEQLNSSLSRQEIIFQDELALIEKDFERSKLLSQNQSISEKEFEVAKGKLLQERRTLEVMRSGIIQNEIRQKQLWTEKVELKELRAQELTMNHVEIQQSISQLNQQLNSWREDYYIIAPIEGVLNYAEGVTPGKFLPATEVISSIIPQQGKGKVIGKGYVPSFGMGKIKIFDQAQIRLDAYPEKEYGVIKAQVNKISPLAGRNEEGEEYHIMEMYLSDTLRTTYNVIIPFRQQGTGVVRIITKDKRLLERLLENVLSILN